MSSPPFSHHETRQAGSQMLPSREVQPPTTAFLSSAECQAISRPGCWKASLASPIAQQAGTSAEGTTSQFTAGSPYH